LEVQFNDVNLLEAEGKIPDAIKTLKGILDATAKKSYSASEKSSRSFLLQTLASWSAPSNSTAPPSTFSTSWPSSIRITRARIEAEIIETYREAKDYPKAEAEADAAVKKYPQGSLVSSRARWCFPT
jgi:hypothetical protein